MKKSALLLPVAFLLVLGSCGKSSLPASSSDKSSLPASSSDASSSLVPEADWTDDELALMKSHLAGEVLPYIEIDDYSVTWDSDNSVITITTTTGGVTGLDTTYQGLLEDEEFAVAYYEASEIYQGDKTIADGKAFYAQFYLSEKEFTIYAWVETPVTSWPSEGITALWSDHSLTVNDTVPAFEADYYFLTDYYDNYSCFTVEVRDQTSVATTEDVYTSTLTKAGWTVDKTDYDNSGVIAMAPNQTIKLAYYLTGKIFSIDIYHNIPKVKAWPTADIASFLGKDITETVPEFTWADGYYVSVSEASEIDVAHMTISMENVTGADDKAKIAATETLYNTTFAGLNWIFDGSDYETAGYYQTSPLEQILVEYYYINDTFTIYIMRNAEAGEYTYATAWPTADIASVLPSGEGAAVLPESAAGTSYSYKAITHDDGGTGIELRVASADMAAAKSAYETVLTTAGYSIPEGKTYYVDNATKPTVVVSLSTSQPSSAGYQYLVITATNYVAPLADGVFNMTKSFQRTSLSADKAVYVSGVVTLTIEKNGSAQDVGNAGQAYLPGEDGYSRFYTTQKLTFDVGEGNAISTIVIDNNGAKGGSSAITTGTITGGTAAALENVVTITASASTSVVTVVLKSQIQVNKIVVNFAAKA